MGNTTEFLIGKRERMAWVAESTYGAGGTMSNGEVVGLNCTLEPGGWSQGWQEILTAGADNRNVQGQSVGNKLYPYKLGFAPVNWKFLKYVMDVVDAGGPVYTHTFTQANTINTWDLEWDRRHTTNHVIRLPGSFAKSIGISWTKPTGEGGQGFIKVSMDCMGRNSSEGTSVTSLNNITTDPVHFRHTLLTIGGSEVIEINNGDIKIDNSINENNSMYANTTIDRLLGDPIPIVFRVTGRFNINLKDKTWYDRWNSGAVIAGTNSVTFDRGTNDTCVFTLSNFRIINGIGPTNMQGVTNADIIWTAEGFTSVVATDSIAVY